MKTQRKIERHLHAAMSYLSFGKRMLRGGRETNYEQSDDDSDKWDEIIYDNAGPIPIDTSTPNAFVNDAIRLFELVKMQPWRDGEDPEDLKHFNTLDFNQAINRFRVYLGNKYTDVPEWWLNHIVSQLTQWVATHNALPDQHVNGPKKPPGQKRHRIDPSELQAPDFSGSPPSFRRRRVASETAVHGRPSQVLRQGVVPAPTDLEEPGQEED